MQIFVDKEQYLLTASYLVAPVLLCYFAFFGLAKLLGKLTGDVLRLPIYAHLICILAACALAPFVALFFVDRPIELHERSGIFILVSAISSFIVVGLAEELARNRRKRSTDA